VTGSGLGLDNARRIVEMRHHGTIGLETSPGGTTFTVRLPKAQP
jgi:signal transduction histidine kinase